MDWLIWIGAAISLGGVGLLLWCVLQAIAARREGLTDAALRARLQRVVVINFAALAVSVLGLMAVIMGIVLS